MKSLLGRDISLLRGFATNVASYQPVGQLCPFVSTDGVKNNYCKTGNNQQSDPCCYDPCNSLSKGNLANNELNYATMLFHGFAAAVPGFSPRMLIDTSRNGVPNSRSNCDSFCNVRNARLGPAPTANTAAPSIVDAYFWIKVPGSSDGCTKVLPDGSTCKRFDPVCASVDAIGSRAGEPRAPEAGEWFDYSIKLLVADPA